MTERPIIFSKPMVLAILAGRKTMTRQLATSPLRKCEPGDRLWVRETWKPHSLYAHLKPREVPETHVFYAADQKYAPSNTSWRPSIFMPRWASRITLEVTSVKTERLQDITNNDALAEGALESGLPYVGAMTCDQARVAFSLLWDCLHGKLSWEHNPEVVAISFRRITQRDPE